MSRVITTLSINEINDLRNEASAFKGHADELKSITDEMLTTVHESSSALQGEIQEGFVRKFEGLADEFTSIYKICAKYATDLNDMADNYELAITYSTENVISTLETDLGVKQI